jgi:hypothetical protein
MGDGFTFSELVVGLVIGILLCLLTALRNG